ncbi:hypothetical protein EDB84DRAFT_1679785 [Lactarius hengduanensis]|nr:hypothetical protein EDB84DRAFT_1679785 [Lactarius hengduanensis]
MPSVQLRSRHQRGNIVVIGEAMLVIKVHLLFAEAGSRIGEQCTSVEVQRRAYYSSPRDIFLDNRLATTYVYSGLRATARSKGLKQSRGDKWRLEEKWAIFFKDQNTEYKYMTADYILGGRVQGFTCASAYTAGTSKTRGRNTTHYLNEVPRQARVTHLVRCISHFSAAHVEIIFGIYGGRNAMVYGRMVGGQVRSVHFLWVFYGKCSTATLVGVGPILAHRRKLLIGSLIGPLPHPRHRVAHVASVLAYISTFDIQSRGLYMREEDVTRSSHRLSTREMVVPEGLCWVRGFALRIGEHWRTVRIPRILRGVRLGSCPGYASYGTLIIWYADGQGVNVFTGFSNSPSHCAFGTITTISLGEEMESERNEILERPYWPRRFVGRFGWAPGSQSGINVLFPSVRAYCTWGFLSAPRERIMLPFPSSESISEAAKVADVSAVFF